MGGPGSPAAVERWGVPGVVAPLALFGILAVYLLARWASPTSTRRRPPGDRDPRTIGAGFASGRGGYSSFWPVTSDEGEYARIYSDTKGRSR